MKTPEEHLATLRQFQAWRTDSEEGIEQPNPFDVSEALEWAIAELEKGKRDGEGSPIK